MKKLLFVALAACSFLLLSCYTTKVTPIADVMNHWIGKSEQDVKLKFGPPDNVTDDGNGGKILDYHRSSTNSLLLPMTNMGVINTQTRTTYVQFYVGAGGKVYSWRTNLPDKKERIKK